jgi:uncharacterized Zn finger protein
MAESGDAKPTRRKKAADPVTAEVPAAKAKRTTTRKSASDAQLALPIDPAPVKRATRKKTEIPAPAAGAPAGEKPLRRRKVAAESPAPAVEVAPAKPRRTRAKAEPVAAPPSAVPPVAQPETPTEARNESRAPRGRYRRGGEPATVPDSDTRQTAAPRHSEAFEPSPDQGPRHPRGRYGHGRGRPESRPDTYDRGRNRSGAEAAAPWPGSARGGEPLDQDGQAPQEGDAGPGGAAGRRRRRGGRRRGRGGRTYDGGPRPEGGPEDAQRQPEGEYDEGADGERPEGVAPGTERPYDFQARGRRGRRRGRRGRAVPLTPEEQAAYDARRAAEAAAKEERRRVAEQQRQEAQRRKAEREAARRAQQDAQRSKRQQQQQRKRGPSFGETWWSARWTAVLETFGWAARVARGAEYARAGAVTDLYMDEDGVVRALVQGSIPQPYDVELSLQHLSEEAWEAVLYDMSQNALLAAQLLAGEMPQDIEEVFFNVGVTLFPYDGQEIYADCDCPDQVNPCKHIAAVFYTLAQEFDRDPFLIFRFRGRSREQVAAYLRALRAESETVEEEESLDVDMAALPLDQALDAFWRVGDSLEGIRLSIAPPVTPGAVLLRLGQPNGWDGARGFIFTMAPYFQALSERALQAAFAEGAENPKVPEPAPE